MGHMLIDRDWKEPRNDKEQKNGLFYIDMNISHYCTLPHLPVVFMEQQANNCKKNSKLLIAEHSRMSALESWDR